LIYFHVHHYPTRQRPKIQYLKSIQPANQPTNQAGATNHTQPSACINHKENHIMPMLIEHTDTYGGEANYCWVNRYAIQNDDLTDRALVRRAKKATGFSGIRCRIENHGDTIAIYPQGTAQVIFIYHTEKADLENHYSQITYLE
jgi:hypothetical protein